MNVSELARRLNVTTKELLEKLPELGFAVGARAIKIDDRQVNKIISTWKRNDKMEAIKRRYQNMTEVRGGHDGPGGNTREITLGSTIRVKELAEKMNLPLAKVMGEMMRNGIMASLNERLDFDTASIIAEDLGFKVTAEASDAADVDNSTAKERLDTILAERQKKYTRPPVVVVMGHVDHGKTKLLDAIRKTNLVAGEAGGITQHIGAYQTTFQKEGHERIITFLDTPGHEAFKTMRSRGGQVADVAVLVVAADDGIKPQTLESLAIIQKENLPFIVAINKIDKENADIERVKKDLTEINLTPEDWGGKTICVPISALKGEGLDDLLDMVLLVADLGDLTADDQGMAVGTVIESHMDNHEGPVATVLMQAGTLRCNDLVTVGSVPGKIKAMRTWKGEPVTEATPGMPVKILGLKAVPQSGDLLHATEDKKAYRQSLKNLPQNRIGSRQTQIAVNNDSNSSDVPVLNLVVKADVLGSLEAIEESLQKLNTDRARVKIVKKGLGFVSEGDVLSAEASHAILIAFHLHHDRQIEQQARDKKIEYLQYDIIYKLLEDIERRLKAMMQPNLVLDYIGKLTVLGIFRVTKNQMILGGRLTEGRVVNPCKVKVTRGEQTITFGDLVTLQSNKEKITEAVAPNEVGLQFNGEPVIKDGDILEFFIERDESAN